MGNELANDAVDLPEAEATAELAKPDDASLYIEQRREDEAGDRPPSEDEPAPDPERKKLSRNERRRAAREALERENETLRAKIERPEAAPKYDPQTADEGALENSLKFAGEKHGPEKFHAAFDAFRDHVQRTGDKATYQRIMASADPGEALVEWFDSGGPSQAPQVEDPYEAALEQGRQATNFQAALAEREAQIRLETEVQFRAKEFAKQVPDYAEKIETLKSLGDLVPPVMAELILRSEVGPAIAYGLATDMEAGGDTIWNLHELANDPITQARLVGAWEQHFKNSMHQASAPRRTTKAPPPVKPIQGGADGPKDLMSLAKSDDISAYAKARLGRG
jgi:hypothetical protein